MSEVKKPWPQIVAESGGKRIFLPDEFKKEAEDVEKMRKNYNKEANKLAEKEIDLTIATQQMFYKIKKHLSKNGRDGIWSEEMGFDLSALEEEIFILNIGK